MRLPPGRVAKVVIAPSVAQVCVHVVSTSYYRAYGEIRLHASHAFLVLMANLQSL